MSALNPEQLQMFMDPKEIMRTAVPVDAGYSVSTSQRQERETRMWDRKMDESVAVGSALNAHSPDFDGPTLVDHIGQHGIETPVDMHHGDDSLLRAPGETRTRALGNGHHRVASAYLTGQLVPVNHSPKAFWGGGSTT